MAHIRRHPVDPSKWQLRYVDPAGRERSRLFKRKIDAEDYLIKVESDKRRGVWVDPHLGKTTVVALIEDMESRRASGRPSTRARDTSYYRNLIAPRFGSCQLRHVRRSDIQDWVRGLVDAGYSPATVHKGYQLLARVFTEAVDRSWIAHTPCNNIDLPRVKRTEMRFLSEDEVRALAGAIKPRYRALVLAGAYTGMRWGELAGLRDRNLDLLRRTITVQQTLAEVSGKIELSDTKTPASRRKITLPKFLARELEAHVSEYRPAGIDFVFTSSAGAPLRRTNFRRRVWLPAVSRTVGEPCRFHDLRHTHAALLIAHGEHAKVIQSRLGHSSIKTTLDTYGHLFDGLDRDAASRLDASWSSLRDGQTTDKTAAEIRSIND